VPGCPPSPTRILQGILAAVSRAPLRAPAAGQEPV
jgi:Ni,Fe-hydrogenase III small subunit